MPLNMPNLCWLNKESYYCNHREITRNPSHQKGLLTVEKENKKYIQREIMEIEGLPNLKLNKLLNLLMLLQSVMRW